MYGCSEALKTTRRKKGTALHDGVGSLMGFFQVTAGLQRMQNDKSASISIRRWCVFFFNTVVFSCCLAFRPNAFFFFAKFVAGLATKCAVKENFWSREGRVQLDKKRWGRTSLCKVWEKEECRCDVCVCNVCLQRCVTAPNAAISQFALCEFMRGQVARALRWSHLETYRENMPSITKTLMKT